MAASGKFARVTQSHHFGMRVPGALRPPPPHHDTVLYDNGTYGRVRSANPDGIKRLLKRKPHVVCNH